MLDWLLPLPAEDRAQTMGKSLKATMGIQRQGARSPPRSTDRWTPPAMGTRAAGSFRRKRQAGYHQGYPSPDTSDDGGPIGRGIDHVYPTFHLGQPLAGLPSSSWSRRRRKVGRRSSMLTAIHVIGSLDP